MASLQKKGESWYCQFMYERRRHTLTIGPVAEQEAKTTAARVDYILMRVRQRLLQVPAGMDIITFIEHDGKAPAAPQPSRRSTLFAELRDAYLKTFSNGALESSTLRTAKLHLRNLARTLGESFPIRTLDLPDLQRHVDRRQKEV